MEFGNFLGQLQRQSLLITPQVQQSLKLLQSSRTELQEMIEHELLENPVLELVDNSELSVATHDDEGKQFHELWCEFASTTWNSHDREGSKIEECYRGNEITLSEHLLRQLLELELSASSKMIAAYIIGNLNDDGYLATACAEMADTLNTSLEDVLQGLTLVQSLEPAGVGARNLKECLMLQLSNVGLAEGLEGRLLALYSKEVESGRFNQIVKKERVDLTNICRAMSSLRRLDPFPGRRFPSEQTSYVTPDVLVVESQGQYAAVLNPHGIPNIRLSSEYQKLISAKGLLSTNDSKFLRGKVRTATWFLRCLSQRDETLLRVACVIVRRQQGFFLNGAEKVVPLSLSDIGEELGLHESTVSRAMANKYFQTPVGLMPFKYFLAARMNTAAGIVATSSLKERIRKLIQKELPESPLSDQEVVKILEKSNITIARRTVGKYRDVMGIESATMRKQRSGIFQCAA